jgi:hypothetical protein
VRRKLSRTTFDVSASSIYMILRLLALAVLCATTGCATDRAEPHGGHSAHRTLSREGYAWRTVEAPGIHLHYLPGGYAAEHAPAMADAAAEALRYDLALAGLPRQSEPVELFLVGSREQMRDVTGWGYRGQAVPGELTAFFIAEPATRPAFRHEIMHALTLMLWGQHRTGTWLAEGVATWAGGGCQGHSVDAIAAGFLRDGTLPRLDSLDARFWETDELHGYFTAASAVGFLARTRGHDYVRLLWEMVMPSEMHPLGLDGAAIEDAWHRHLSTVPPARIDPERLRLHGCQTP